MAVRPILLYPDPTLRRVAQAVGEFDARLRELVDDMAETMYDAPGVGLAAPQVGIEMRVAVVDVEVGTPASRLHVLVNPRILATEGRQTGEEGCLSIPGVTDSVDRPARVTVGALDVDGRPFELAAEGLLARAICHEIDHLDGILFVDRLTGLRKESMARRLRRLPYVREAGA
jgi:peptide deformylase